MQASVSFITLGVDDLERAVSFYRDGLGLPTKGIVGIEYANGAAAFFNLQQSLKLALWPRTSLAAEAAVEISKGSSTEFALAHNVSSRSEVDRILAQAEAAGGKIVRQAHDTFYGGYAGYFQDPDGHLWEIAFNPGFESLG